MDSLFLISGLCAIESEEMTMYIAEKLKEITKRLKIEFYFKASFDKANRTSLNSYRGPGIDEGVRILKLVKNTFQLKICTDIHEPWQAEKVAEAADIIQIPAFLCRQTDLLLAAGRTGKTINIKKAQFLAPWDMKNVLEKIESTGNKNIMLCERGSSFGYNNLVVDMTSIPEMKKMGYPVVFDVTHSVQKPGGNGTSTGGNREYIPYLAKAAVAAGADGIFMEVHPDPDHALSDGANCIGLFDLENLLQKLKELYIVVNEDQRLCRQKKGK